MESNSSTIAVPSGVQTDNLTPTDEHRRGMVGWAVVFAGCVAVVALAIVAWLGGTGDQVARTTPINPNAERIEREAHLDGQARTYRSDARIVISADAAERAARSDAHIVISADAAERAAQGSAATATEDEPDFLSGSRRVPAK